MVLSLSRRPAEHPSSEKMQVEVVDGLARARVDIEDSAITLLMDVRLHREFLGNLKDLADKSVIFRR